MFWLVGLMTLSIVATMAAGFYYHARPQPRRRARRWFRGTLLANVTGFLAIQLWLLILGTQQVLAQTAATTQPREISIGLGLALIGAGLPTALATIAAAMAVGPVGAAALAVIAEKPEIFGRSLVYLGLAEGIAIYGLVVSILILGAIG